MPNHSNTEIAETKKKKRSNLIRAVLFLLVLALAFAVVQSVFKVGDNRAFQSERGLYKEKSGTLDAVYVGASNVHAFWEPPYGWKDHGIAVLSYSVDSLPMRAVKYMIIEARKTQPDALYIVNLNSFKDPDVTEVNLHRAVNYLRFSGNKVSMINALADDAGIGTMDRVEFFFPIVRFHSGWSELTSWDFDHGVNGLKMGIVYNPYLYKTEDVSGRYHIVEDTEEITEEQTEILEELLDYCDSEDVNVLFVTVPQAINSTAVCARLNRIEEIVQERGYPCLDILAMADELEIWRDTDFYNVNHTNVHGSLKFCEYLGQYLVDNYGFEDKRGQPGWESWDESVELYEDIIGPYTLPFERSHADRNYDLAAPTLSKLSIDGQDITLTWKSSEGAEGYDIYRKTADEWDGYWSYYATVDGDTLSYSDTALAPETEYTYTVVPFSVEDDTELYGNFDFVGVKGTTEAAAEEMEG